MNSDNSWHPEKTLSGWETLEHPRPTLPASPGKPLQPQRTPESVKIITEYPVPPAVTHSGVTVEPIAVTHRSTVTLPGGQVTTTDEVKFEIVVGSSTLGIGATVTVNNVAIGLTTNDAGSTVLRAGDMTSTLPMPTAGEVRTITANSPKRLDVATAVVNGNTEYILAGKTLAPGQPVTIGDTPISITIISDRTVLYVGNKTTTVTPGNTGRQTITDLPKITSQAGSTGAAATSKNAGSLPCGKGNAGLEHFAIFIMTFLGIAWI